MTVRQLRDKLEEVTNQELDVVILSDSILFESAKEVFEDEVGYDNKDVRKCIRIK